MNIRELKSFCMVVKLGSFSEAAKTLGIGQPSISKHVQRLESKIGHPLIERDSRPLRLTGAGSNLYRMAEPFIEGVETLEHRYAGLTTIPITVAVPHGFVGYILPEAVKALRRELPTTRVRILTGTKEEIFELIQAGHADIAITPDPGGSRHFNFVPLFTSERILITSKDHPLLKTAPTSLAQVAEYPLILPRFQTTTRALLESEFRRLKVRYEIAIELDSLELLPRYVALKLGIAVGLRGSLSAQPYSDLGMVSLQQLLPTELIGLIHSRSTSLSAPAHRLSELLQEKIEACSSL